MKRLVMSLIILITLKSVQPALAENGYDLWLRYVPVKDVVLKKQYSGLLRLIYFPAGSDRLKAAHQELERGLSGLIGHSLISGSVASSNMIVAKLTEIGILQRNIPDSVQKYIGNEGFVIKTIG